MAGAYHEAGHAVVGKWCGWWLNDHGVQISTDGTEYRDYTGLSCQGRHLSPQRSVLVSLAGPMAERKFARMDYAFTPASDIKFFISTFRMSGSFDEPDPLDDGNGTASDTTQALEAILEGSPGATDDEIASAFREYERNTIAVINRAEVWAAIEAVAGRLFETGFLSNEEVDDTLHNVGMDSDFERAFTD